MFAERAVQWATPKSRISEIWLTITEMTETRVYLIAHWALGVRARSRRSVIDKAMTP